MPSVHGAEKNNPAINTAGQVNTAVITAVAHEDEQSSNVKTASNAILRSLDLSELKCHFHGVLATEGKRLSVSNKDTLNSVYLEMERRITELQIQNAKLEGRLEERSRIETLL